MAKYLVTGGAGFIGSNIVEELLNSGQEVRVVDNFSTGKRENISVFLDKIELIEGDIGDLSIARQSVEGIDYVLHQAALPSVPRSINDPIASNKVNVVGTLNLLQMSKDAHIKRFIYASSSSIYGNLPGLPRKENMVPCPLSPYAVSKLTGEYYCKVFCEIYGLEVVVLRYFNVFGPRQDPTSQYSAVIPKFIAAILKGQGLQIFGDGKQSRDFTFVENVVKANLLATSAQNVAGEIFNIACGETITINQVVETLRHLLKAEFDVAYLPRRTGDVKHSFADYSKANRQLGYKPEVSFEEGLAKTIEWLMKVQG